MLFFLYILHPNSVSVYQTGLLKKFQVWRNLKTSQDAHLAALRLASNQAIPIEVFTQAMGTTQVVAPAVLG